MSRTGSRGRAHPLAETLDKEIEEKEHRPEEKQHKGRVCFAACKADKVSEELRAYRHKAGLLPGNVKGADDRVAGEIAPEGAEFVVHADKVMVTLAPDEGRANREGDVTDQR
ncbi:MAG: hypothetical protein ABSH39_15660 [Candidatus Acidiferrum sp.]